MAMLAVERHFTPLEQVALPIDYQWVWDLTILGVSTEWFVKYKGQLKTLLKG